MSADPRSALLAAAAALSLLASVAEAHTNTRAYVDLKVEGKKVELTLRSTRRDLSPLLEVAPGIRPIAALYRARRERLLAHIPAHVLIYNAATQQCRAGSGRMTIGPGDQVSFRFSYRCPHGKLELRYGLLFATDPDHRAFVSIRGITGPKAGTERLAVLRRDKATLRFTPDLSRWSAAREFLALGVHHIFGGYDHVLFLLALLLAAPLVGERTDDKRARGASGDRSVEASDARCALRASIIYLLKVVTAFTVAHSITLGASALGWVSLPSRLVESAIALSIAYVGAENLVRPRWRHRWWIVLLFGLVHGFGFAHVLQEIGLPEQRLLISLLCFNLGVELGQLAIVALAFPLIHLLSRPISLPSAAASAALLASLLGALAAAGMALGWWPLVCAALLLAALLVSRRAGYLPVLRGGSAIVIAFGLLWLAQRAFDFTVAGGLLG